MAEEKLCTKERASIEEPHEEAEIQCEALKRIKNLACSKKHEQKRVWSPRKVGMELKQRDVEKSGAKG